MKSGRVKYYSFSVAALRGKLRREQTKPLSRSGQTPATCSAVKPGALSGNHRQPRLPQRVKKIA
jgi:hypothetical protein